jgi:predicted RNA-binding protein associated with RNAse of E/G family
MWKPGDAVVWRGIFKNRVWHAVPSFVVKDTLQELVLAVMPGTNCMVEENYAKEHKNGKRRWDFKDKDWLLEKFTWHTNRLLFLLEPEKYYSTIFFWNNKNNKFKCYYINFQLPFQRSHCGIDTLDLDLDLIINPDFSYEWKDVDDYQKAIETEVIIPEWIQGIESTKEEIIDRLENRQYPFDGSWLDWLPDRSWSPPTLLENWDKL